LLGGSACAKHVPSTDPGSLSGGATVGREEQAGQPLAPIPPETPLSQVPFLMAHDAATTYRHHYSLLGRLLPSQVQTQPEGGFAALLDCGVRALDVRPCHTLEARLYMHHGPVIIEHRLEDALGEVVQWAGEHPEELVLVYLSHCGGGIKCGGGIRKPNAHCDAATADVLGKLGISLLQSVDISYGVAREMARLGNGGLVLAFTQAQENYDERIQYCAGPKVRASDFGDLFAYMDEITAEPPAGSTLVIVQAHWQDPHTTLVDGCAETVLRMETASLLNRELARRIAAGQWPYLNLLEVDNACDQGTELYAALRGRLAGPIAR
jgi:hypothetical protein